MCSHTSNPTPNVASSRWAVNFVFFLSCSRLMRWRPHSGVAKAKADPIDPIMPDTAVPIMSSFPTSANTSQTQILDPTPLRAGRQRVHSSATLLEDPHASLMTPARRRPGMNVMIPMGGLGSRFKTGASYSLLLDTDIHERLNCV